MATETLSIKRKTKTGLSTQAQSKDFSNDKNIQESRFKHYRINLCS